MNRWQFTVKELASLQQERPDADAIVQAYVEWVLLKGYTITTSKRSKLSL